MTRMALAVPVGSVVPFAGASAPAGWLACDGSEVPRSQYPALFAAIGTAYGEGDGSTTFSLPNLLGRVPVGAGSPDGHVDFDLGHTGGEVEVALAVENLPAHKHSASTSSTGAHNHSLYIKQDASKGTTAQRVYPSAEGGGEWKWSSAVQETGAHTHTITVGNTGGGAAHNNLQPYTVLNYIIRAL